MRNVLIFVCAIALAACGDEPADAGSDAAETTTAADTTAAGGGSTTAGDTTTGTGTSDGSDTGTGSTTTGGETGGTTGGEDPECLSDGHCANKVDPGTCEHAACVAGTCEVVADSDGAPCEALGVCISAGACLAGACQGTPKACNDGDLCTTDTCDPMTGDCMHAPADDPDCTSQCTNDLECASEVALGPCHAMLCKEGTCETGVAADGAPCATSDAGLCVVGGACTSGACEAVAKDCNDGLECTADACDEATGACVNTESADGCGEAACESAADCVEVIAGVACKAAVCTDGQCGAVASPDGAQCEDPLWADNACISGGACVEGTCVAQEKDCNDQLECTTDSCDSTTGQCAHLSESEGCGKGCSEQQDCAAGEYCHTSLFGDDLCKPIKAEGGTCDDQFECTAGYCGGCPFAKWCYVPESKAVGESCFVDEECGSGACTVSCLSTFPKAGVCECQVDTDCGVDHYCDSGLTSFGTNKCLAKKPECSDCDNNFECLSDFCDEGFLGFGGSCITTGSLPVDGACCTDTQCGSGNCKDDKCVGCGSDSDCDAAQKCDNGGCVGKLALGQTCANNAACQTGNCESKTCSCVTDGDCADMQWCDTSFLGQNKCESLVGECGECTDHEGCDSGVCQGLFSPFKNQCITEDALVVGEPCCKKGQCKSGVCDEDDTDTSVCQCDEDSDCPPNQTCDNSAFGPNVCTQ